MIAEDKTFLIEFIEKEKMNPMFYRHNIYSYESNIFNTEFLKQEILAGRGENVKQLFKKEIQKNPQILNNVKTKKDLCEQLEGWMRYYSGKTHIEFSPSKQFGENEEIKVVLEQLNKIDFKRQINYRKSVFHSHSFFEIIYVFTGKCTTTIENIPVLLKEGDICIFNLQAVHQISLYDENAVVFNILVSKNLFENIFVHLIQGSDFLTRFFMNSIFNIVNPGQHLVFHRQEKHDCEIYIGKIITEYYKNPVDNQTMIKSLLMPFLTSLFYTYKNILSQKSTHHHLDMQIDINKIIAYISKNYSSITLSELAEHFKYSQRSMIRIIQKFTHRNFKDIVRQFRVQGACDLLTNTDLSIAEVAEKVGCSERSYLDRLFKEQYQISAYEYRQKNKK